MQFGVLFEVLVAARAHFCGIDDRVLAGMQFGVLFEVLVAARAHFCEIDDRVLGGVLQFGVLVQVLWDARWQAARG